MCERETVELEERRRVSKEKRTNFCTKPMQDQEFISGFLKALSIPMHTSLIEIFHLQERKRLNTP